MTTRPIPINLQGEFTQGEREYSCKQDRYVATGEFRCPLKGEYYLSGSVVEAYRAFTNWNSPYWIAVKKENTMNTEPLVFDADIALIDTCIESTKSRIRTKDYD